MNFGCIGGGDCLNLWSPPPGVMERHFKLLVRGVSFRGRYGQVVYNVT